MVRTRLTPKYGPGELPVEATGLRWEDVIINEIEGPVEFAIKPSTHQKHCDLLEIHHPYLEKEQHIFPWEYNSGYRVGSQWKTGRFNQAIQASMSFDFFRPAKVGDRLLAYQLFTDKFERRGRKYMSFLNDTVDAESGELVSRFGGDVVLMTGQPKPAGLGEVTRQRQDEGAWGGASSGAVPTNTPNLPIGTEFPNQVTGPCPMRVSGHTPTGWDASKWIDNIHSDDYAQRLGYERGVAESPVAMEYATLLTLVEFYGADVFFSTGKIFVKVTGPVYVGDHLIGKFRVRDRWTEGAYYRTVLDVRIEKSDGSLCQVGTASALNAIPAIEE
jgi:hypothetical protein